MNQNDIEIGDELSNLKGFTYGMSSRDKGFALGNSEVIKSQHNSFARQDPFEIEVDKKATDDDDVFHFISYVPFKGHLYELDGLQEGPINLGQCTNDNWLDLAREEIMSRIQKY